MGSLLPSTRNTRALPTGSLRYIRSDVPEKLTAGEIRWLLDNDITTIVDLRSEKEALQRPCCLAERAGFRYVRLPVAGGGDTPRSLEHLYTVYRRMLDETMEKIVETVMNAGSNVLYFCTAGKDRTGVVSAVLMKRLGFDDEAVIADYMKSKENLLYMLTEYARAHPEVDLEIIVPHRKNMEQFLQYLQEAPHFA